MQTPPPVAATRVDRALLITGAVGIAVFTAMILASAWVYDAGKPTVSQQKVERNQPCPCGSGRKFKQCHA